jgi:hypothetical protein
VEPDLVHREERLKAECRHSAAADADKTNVAAETRGQSTHEASAELVARLFSGKKENRERALDLLVVRLGHAAGA